MSKRLSVLKHWPLLLATLLLCAAFALLFLASVNQARDARSAELSLDSSRAYTVPDKGLTLSTRLGELPPTEPLPRLRSGPGPWWPAMLFGAAFFCGWLFRNTLQRNKARVTGTVPEANLPEPELTPAGSDEHVFTPGVSKHETSEEAPDLAVDFPWDESALRDSTPLSNEERIHRLEKQNASKAEIIKALERLVTENREKWLHQDETEARLDKHIQDLTDDLQVAVRQLQDLQASKPATEPKPLKNII